MAAAFAIIVYLQDPVTGAWHLPVLEFETEVAFKAALSEVADTLSDPSRFATTIANEKCDTRSWGRQYFHAMSAGPVDPFDLPPELRVGYPYTPPEE